MSTEYIDFASGKFSEVCNFYDCTWFDVISFLEHDFTYYELKSFIPDGGYGSVAVAVWKNDVPLFAVWANCKFIGYLHDPTLNFRIYLNELRNLLDEQKQELENLQTEEFINKLKESSLFNDLKKEDQDAYERNKTAEFIMKINKSNMEAIYNSVQETSDAFKAQQDTYYANKYKSASFVAPKYINRKNVINTFGNLNLNK